MNTLTHPSSGTRPIGRAAFFLFLLLGGQLIFVFASPYFDVFPTNHDPLFAGALAGAFALLAAALSRNPHYARYAPPVYALFTAAAANLALVIGPLNRFITATEPYRLMAEDKLVQFLTVVPVLVLLSWGYRRDLGRIFMQRGRPRRWLPFGLAGLAAGAVAMVWLLLSAGMTADRLLSVAPWIAVFVASNALMEELWFRGIFLRPYETEIGWAGTMTATALAYGTSHMNATYFESTTGLLFGLGVIGFGFILAWAMRWTDSIWGSVLFHMGMDLVIILPVVQSI